MQVISRWEPGTCRGHSVSINHPQGAEYCTNCNHYTILDYLRKCECCQLKVTRRRTFHSEVRVFDRIIEQNRNLLEYYAKHPVKTDNMAGFSIKIGYRTYLVSIEHLVEYMAIPNTRNPDKIAPFFGVIRSNCLQLMPGTVVR